MCYRAGFRVYCDVKRGETTDFAYKGDKILIPSPNQGSGHYLEQGRGWMILGRGYGFLESAG